MTCAICNDAISRESRVDVRQASDIEISANKCEYCRIILKVLNEHDVKGNQRLHITNDSDTSRTRATHGINILVIKAGQIYGSQFDFVIRSLKGLDSKTLFEVIYSGCTYTGSSRAFEWAEDQIKTCQDTHETCKSELHTIPDRLLWLGKGDANDLGWLEADVKLYESRGETGLYATLSHRWGMKQPLRLLEANIAGFKNQIPWSNLPKTFQQAINFARRLHIPYLWIDSLCIIQDSTEDWNRQSMKMASIYENSSVTLAASVAENGDAGCFIAPPSFLEGYVTNGISKAKPDDLQAILDLTKTHNQRPIAFIRGASEHPMPSEHLPLLTRGWVFQERLLSPRILHFSHVDLIFECSWRTECYCKKQAGVASRSVRSHPPKLQHANALGKGLFKGVGGHLNAYAERWCAIIEEYSVLDLTFAKDRLPAIAGLAKQMARYMPEARYMSGVWTERLAVYLSWRRRTNPPTTNGPRYRPGPSWTWATMLGAISFPAGSFYLQRPVPGFQEFSDPWPTVVGLHFDHEGDKDFMLLKDGSITLRGVLVEVQLRKLQTSQHSETGIIPVGLKERFTSVTLDHEPDDYELRSEWGSITPEWAKRLTTPSADGSSLAQALQETEDLEDEFPLRLWQSPLQSILEHKERMWAFCLGMWLTDGSRMDQYLLLERIEESSHTFRRIGLGDCIVNKSFFREISERQDIILK